jgi:hypothetical protein
MSTLLGADSRRVDLLAEGLRGHSQEIDSLRMTAQRVVAELRGSWSGYDFEGIAQRWEQEAAPRLADVSAALCAMATALGAQAEEQRRASGNIRGTSSLGPSGAFGRDQSLEGRNTSHVDAKGWPEIGSVDFTDGANLGMEKTARFIGGDGVSEPTSADRIQLNLARGDATLVDESLTSVAGQGQNYEYELSAGKVEAEAEYSVDLDVGGNLSASAGASAGAYAAHATGKLYRGNDFANGVAEGTAYVGAEVKADAEGSIGPDGARAHLGAEAFAGAKADVKASGTLAGATATVGAEISLGIGAHADVDGELSTTRVGFAADIGATLGIGTGFAAEVSVNPEQVIANVNRAAEGVGEGLALAGNQVETFFDW